MHLCHFFTFLLQCKYICHSLLLYLLFSPYNYYLCLMLHLYSIYNPSSHLAWKTVFSSLIISRIGISSFIFRCMITDTRIGISSFIFEISDKPLCYVRQCSHLMLNYLDCLGDWCHIYSYNMCTVICRCSSLGSLVFAPHAELYKMLLIWFTIIILYYDKYSLLWLQQ